MNAMKCFFVTGLGLGLAYSLSAGTNGFVVPSFRGSPNAQFAGWETFTVATDNGVGNLPDLLGSKAIGALIQHEPHAAVLGSGNIYNQDFKSEFEVRYSASGNPSLVVLQVRTAGNELAYDSVKLTYAGGSESADRTELNRVSFGAPGTPGSGAFVASKWEWDVTGKKAGNFSIRFNSADVSVSLDSLTLDVRSVPEPTTWALLLSGMGLLGWTALRRTSP